MGVGTLLARCGFAARRVGAIPAALALAHPLPAAAAEPGERVYDIASQDLEAALLVFSRVSGIDIVYDRALLRGKRSDTLRGRFAPPVAVATLLRHSALTHRFTSATAVLILRSGPTAPADGPDAADAPADRAQLALGRMRVTTGRMIGARPADYRPFGQLVQGTIMRRLQDNAATQARRFEARLAVYIDAQGVVRPLQLESGSGDAVLDAAILRVLDGLALPEAPPEGMPQPVWFEIVQR